ncbi:MAG: NlpC/P60 family protein [Paraclostridium sp.]
MKRKILVPMFASIMALSMNGVANADEVKTEKSEDQIKEQKTDETTKEETETQEISDEKEVSKGVIELAEFKDLDYKVASIKEGVVVKIRKEGSVQTVAYTGDEFRIVGEQDDWYKVDLGEGSEGWIASRFVDVKGATGYITAEKVNLRKEANVDAEIHEELDLSSKVEVLGTEDNWLKVKKGENEGYVRNLYVSDEAPVIEEPEVVVNEEQVSEVVTNGQTTNNTNQSTNNGGQSSNNNSQASNDNNQSSNNTQKPVEKPVETPAPPAGDSNKASAVLNLAYSKLGSPYEWGAEGPNTFDCSGFTSYVFRNAAGISIPRTSGSQYGAGRAVSKSDLMAGDLVFFSSNGGASITHVGIYVGGGNMVHSPRTGDVVKVSSINSSYYTKTYVGARRVL